MIEFVADATGSAASSSGGYCGDEQGSGEGLQVELEELDYSEIGCNLNWKFSLPILHTGTRLHCADHSGY